MNHIKWSTILLVISLPGCIWNIDKPPSPSWTYYAGNGATEDEIKSAFLECGYPVPGDFNDFPQEVRSQLGYELGDIKKMYAASVPRYLCMKNAGFPTGRLPDPCKGRNAASYPVCQPGAVIPVRSVETRLNSPYCKITPKSYYCQPEFDPKAPNCKLFPNADLCQPGYDSKAPKPKSPAQ